MQVNDLYFVVQWFCLTSWLWALTLVKDSRNALAKLFSFQTLCLINTKAILEKKSNWRYWLWNLYFEKKERGPLSCNAHLVLGREREFSLFHSLGVWAGRWRWVASSAGASCYFCTFAYSRARTCCACSRCGTGGL